MTLVIVFFQHYYWLMICSDQTKVPIKLLSFLYEKGYYFVETFFVLSGFGMATGYARKLKDTEDVNIFSFLCARMKKLFPIMTVALFATIFLQIIWHLLFGTWFQVSEVTVYSFILSLLNISSGWFVLDKSLNMPLWYISALMLDYVIFYCICRVSKKDRGLYLFLSAATFCWGVSIIITGKCSDQAFTYYNVSRGHACFFTGVLLKAFVDYVNVEKARSRIATFFFVFFSFIMGCCFVFHSETKILASTQWLSQMIYGNVLSPMLIWICLFFRPLQCILRIKPLVFLGNISSSLYIWHFPLYQVLRLLTCKYSVYYGSLWLYTLVILYMLIFAFLSKRIIEPKLNTLFSSFMHGIHTDTKCQTDLCST